MNRLAENCSAILLVGEASFSFSASLSKHLSNHGNHVQMTCSSYESEEDVKGKLKGGQNVQVLKQHGAEVLYELDATKLQESALLADRRFDAIIFNFPHIGKKAGIKKNRQLLKEFFVSCSHMTSDSGKVIVSLCNGQGGTPMDSPQRELNNSWQIVAMATYGGFILTSAIPFALDASDDYSSTGYRGQNKGFHTEGAITHIFETSLPVTMPPFTGHENITVTADVQGIGRQEDELRHFINRKLLHEENHPLHAMSSQLISEIKSHIPELQEQPCNSLPIALQQTYYKCPTTYGIDLVNTGGNQGEDGGRDVWVKGARPARGLHKSGQSVGNTDCMLNAEVFGNVEVSGAHPTRGLHEKSSQGLQSDDTVHSDSGERIYSLVSNILQYLPMILDQNPLHPVACTSEVFRRCTISRNTLPIMHQMLIVVPQPNELWNDYLNLELGITDFELDGEGPMRIGRAACQSLDKGMRESSNICHSSFCSLPPTLKVTAVDSMESYGKVTYKSKLAKFMVFSLDQYVMNSDIRMLWSDDPRQWTSLQQQFEAAEQQADQLTNLKSKESVKELQALQPVSKFPVTYTHDLSFWVTAESRFDKLKFFSLLRKIAGLVLEEVMLIDTYEDEGTEWSSLCYRLVYRSLDRALSKDQAAQIQLVVREVVRKELYSCVEGNVSNRLSTENLTLTTRCRQREKKSCPVEKLLLLESSVYTNFSKHCS